MGNKEIIARNEKNALCHINAIQTAILDSDLPGKEDMESDWHVARQSWAGITRTPVTIIKVCPKRIRVSYSDGREKYVPKYALCRYESESGHWIGWHE